MRDSLKNTVLKFDDVFEVVINSAYQLGTERIGIDSALNRMLAEDVISDTDMPPFNKSAMDGYACRRADLANNLTVVETIAAGYTPQKAIRQKQCSKIMTGAVVPEGADCVIMKEYVKTPTEKTVRFVGEKTDDNICRKGEDVKAGDIVLHKGCRLKPQQIAVLATCGCVKPLVALQPRVGIIATGDELVEPGKKPMACQIRNSNGFTLAAQVESIGAIATNYGIVKDIAGDIEKMFKAAVSENDVVILSGGVSEGELDLVPVILKKNNVKLLFEKIAIKPGKPTVFGTSDKSYCFGLPGNPVSTFVLFEILVKPFLYKLMGCDYKPATIKAPLATTILRKKTGRDSWVPVLFTENGKVAKVEYHGSAHINALCKAQGLLCISADVAELKEETTVAVRQI